ncbi:hypothetical protein PLICRDRAFT_154651 [Plicaturopsis crispa FD-325 SS-3]|nr:hypothetical protein PLICRDRAFT_154651 [Plicaturopsis crispa FD-325 SS-3]
MLASSSRNTLKRASQKRCTDINDTGGYSGSLSLVFSRCTQTRNAHLAQRLQSRRGQASKDESTNLRHNPWTFSPDSSWRGTLTRAPLARHNIELSRHAESGRFIDALKVCKAMKEQGVQPDLFSYNYLLAACAENGYNLEAWAIFDDMKEMGVRPDLTTFHHLIHANRLHRGSVMWEVLDTMQQYDVEPTPVTFSYIIDRYLSSKNLELSLQYMKIMHGRGLVPELRTAQGIISLAADLGQARLALDLAATFEDMSVRRLDNEVWVKCLIASARSLHADGVRDIWNIVVNDLNVQPDEGLCIEVLHTAARHGLPDLGADVIRVLKLMGAKLQEHHFAPIIEAFCHSDRVKDALATLHIMRSNGIDPVPETTKAILNVIGKNIDTVDATWAMLDALREENRPIDVTALNVIIEAALNLEDIQRAVGTYKVFPDHGVKPNIDTFNLLLGGCVTVAHRELGDRMMKEMKDADLKPNRQTYERLVSLCLTQENYEDAFFYLEEMKAQKFLPTITVYEELVRTCVQAQDSRYKLAVDEMQECGYTVSAELQQYIDDPPTDPAAGSVEVDRDVPRPGP